MMRNMRRQSSISHSRLPGRIRNRGSITSDNALCKHSDGRVVTGSEGSLTDSTTSIEKNLVFGKTGTSESYLLKSTFGKMPDWMTMQGMEYQQRARSIPNFLAGGNYGYTHAVYEAAADIFERLAERKPVGECLVQYPSVKSDALPPAFDTQRMKRQAYELAYETLKYQQLLEEILSDSGYFFDHPAGEDLSALVMVMVFDFQNRKWTPRCHIIGEKLIKHVSDVEHSIFEHRVRLAASLARCRVKHQSLSIDYVLPEEVRKQEKCASTLPQYAWVNTVKSNTHSVIEFLEKNHYVEFIDDAVLIPQKGKFYRKDLHCEDVLVFPGDQKEALKCLEIVEDYCLVLQDKTSSLAVRSVAALLTEDDECDLIHADIGSGLTTAHLAIALTMATKKRMEAKELMYGRASHTQFHDTSLAGPSHATTKLGESEDVDPQPSVWAFGLKSEDHRDQMAQYMLSMGLLNVKLMSEKFEDVDPKHDNRFERVKAILVTPQCTRTAIANPIEFMLNEGDKENYNILKDLSLGERHKKAVEAGLVHTEELKRALKFPKVQAVIYVTRSIHGHENELVVNSAIKWHRENPEGVHTFKVCPPTLPLLSNDINTDNDKPSYPRFKTRPFGPSGHLNHNFLRMRQTAQMNGCFIAVLSREFDVADAGMVKDVLRRAALQGLIAPEEKKAASPPKPEKEEIKEEPAKPTKVKSKVGFGKRVKAPPLIQHHAKPTAKMPPLAVKPIDAVNVNQFLENQEKLKQRPRGLSIGKTTTITLGGLPNNTMIPHAQLPTENQQKGFHSQEPRRRISRDEPKQ